VYAAVGLSVQVVSVSILDHRAWLREPWYGWLTQPLGTHKQVSKYMLCFGLKVSSPYLGVENSARGCIG